MIRLIPVAEFPGFSLAITATTSGLGGAGFVSFVGFVGFTAADTLAGPIKYPMASHGCRLSNILPFFTRNPPSLGLP